MALTAQEIEQLGQAIGKAIAKGGSQIDPIAVETKRDKQDAAQAARDEDILRANKQIADTLSTSADTEKKLLRDVTKRLSKNIAGVQALPDHFKAALDNTGSTYLNNIAGEISDLSDISRAQGDFGNLPNLIPVFESFVNGSQTIDDTFQKILELGYSFDQANDLIKPFEQLQTDANGAIVVNERNTKLAAKTLNSFDKITETAGDTLHDFGESVDKASERQKKVAKVGGVLKQVFTGLSAAGKLLLDNLQATAKFGVELDIVGANLRGLQMGEWAETLADSRAAVLSLSGGMAEFEGIVSSGAAMSLTAFTGDLGESTKGLAAMVQHSRMLGDSTIDSAKFVEQQTSTFKRLHNTLSMTIQDFTQLNKELVNDTDIRNIMMRLSGTERTAKMQSLQQDYESYRAQGLLHDQAVQLAKTMDRMAGKDPRERMKEAAKMRSAMSALGMSDVAASRAQELIVRGSRRGEGESKELALLTAEANKLVQAQKGESLQGEIFAAALIQRTGVGERLSTTDNLVLAEGMKQDERIAKQMAHQTSLAKQLLGPVGLISTLLSPGGPIGAAILVTAGVLSIALAPIVAPIVTMALILGTLVTIVGGLAYSIATWLGNVMADMFPDFFKDAGLAIGKTISDYIDSATSFFGGDSEDEKKAVVKENKTNAAFDGMKKALDKNNELQQQQNDLTNKQLGKTGETNEITKQNGKTTEVATRTYRLRNNATQAAPA